MDVTSAWGTTCNDILPVSLSGVLLWLYPTCTPPMHHNMEVLLQWWELLILHIPLSLGLSVDAAQLKMHQEEGTA